MIEPIQKDATVQELYFGNLTVPDLRAELERYRFRWRCGQVTWRVLKTAERMLKSEIKFRVSDPIE